MKPRLRPALEALITAAVVRDWAGAPLGLRWMIREVPGQAGTAEGAERADLEGERVARRRAEDEADALRGLLGGIDVIAWGADAQTGRYWFISPRIEALLGYPAENWLAEPEFWAEIIHPDDRSMAESHRRICLSEGRPAELEYRAAAADGRLVWLRESLHIEPQGGSRPRSLLGCLCEVTRRKGLEQQLQADRSQLATHLTDVWHLFLCGSRLLSTRELLPTLEEILEAVTAIQGAEVGLVRLLDRDRGELETAVSKGLPAAYLDRFGRVPLGVETCGLAVARGGPVIVEDIATDPAAAGWVEAATLGGYRTGLSVPMVSQSGELVGTVAAFFREPRRLSDWQVKLVEQYVCQAAEAVVCVRQHLAIRDADRRKEEFLATLAHELRNPLNAIQTCGHLLRPEGLDAASLGEVRDVIVRQTRYMSRLVEDLLDVTRISRGTIALRKESVELAEVVARAVADVRPLVEARGHQLAVALPAEPARLEADPTRLEQILSNLLTNAAKYTDPGGRIDLIATREADELVLTVRDTGIGMTPEALVDVFNLFNQVEATDDRTRGGLGIGLALVKNLTERHGGTVSAHSDGPGLGSAFVVRLPVGSVGPPAAPARAPGAGPDGHPPTVTRTMRVLIVAVEPDLAQMLSRWIQSRGHAVELAHDVQPALDAASIWPPQVVLLDLDIPGINGLDVARRLRQQAGRLPRIVAMTASDSSEDRDRAREAGIDDLRVKPIDLEHLDRWLESARS